MSTQNNPKIDAIIRGMMASGVPAHQAVAVGMAMEHALACPEYGVQYGTFCRDSLIEFVDKAAP